MNLLLINPPFIMAADNPASQTGAVLPPLGLMYLAAYIREKNPQINIKLLDCPSYKLTISSFRKKLKQFKPDIVGLTVYTAAFPAVIKATEIIKKTYPRCIIIAGGPHPSILPEECLKLAKIDIAVIGEGELAVNGLINCFLNKKDISSVPNIVYKKKAKIFRTEREDRVIDLDSLPYPARDLVDMKRYRPAHGTFRRLPATNMITSRGCPYGCSFCSKNIFGRRYRTQSPEKSVKEIEMLIAKYGIKEILFNDDVFTCNRVNTERFCDLIIKKKLDITWACSTRVNFVDPGLLQKMKTAGCISIGFGIEVGDVKLLKKIDKRATFSQAKQAIRWVKMAGIETRSFYILGVPGETKKTLEKTLNLALKLNTDFVIFNLAMPLPGTAMYEEAKAGNLLLFSGIELYKRVVGSYPLIKLTDVTPNQLLKFYKHAYKKYYFRFEYFTGQLKHLQSLSDLKRYIIGFYSFIKWQITYILNTS